MEAFLKLSVEDQRRYLEQAQAKLGLPPASIEKDFWVCWTLQELFSLPGWGEHLIFKGGTSLSKAWKLIERFSEDLDVVIDREFLGFSEQVISRNQQKKLMKECRRRIDEDLRPLLITKFSSLLPEGAEWTLVLAEPEEDPDQQTILFMFPGVLREKIGYLRSVVKIEMGARSDPEPWESPVLHPYLCEAFPELGSGEFSVRTVAPRRTFWEKAMLLHEETFRQADSPRKKPLARHYYDLWSLITKGVAAEAVADDGLFERVVAHRQVFFPRKNVDYGSLKPGLLRLLPDEAQITGWRRDYDAMQDEMFFGEVPTFDQILSVVGEFESEFNNR
jgi:hypothetical protein